MAYQSHNYGVLNIGEHAVIARKGGAGGAVCVIQPKLDQAQYKKLVLSEWIALGLWHYTALSFAWYCVGFSTTLT